MSSILRRIVGLGPRLPLAIGAGLALALALWLFGPGLRVGADRPLSAPSTRLVLAALLMGAALLWAARRSQGPTLLGLASLLIVQGGAAWGWASARPLQSAWARGALIALLVSGYLAHAAWQLLRHHASGQALRQIGDALRRLLQPAPAAAGASAATGGAVRARTVHRQWEQLYARAGWVGRLRARRALGSLPWYVVLGAEHSGKSALLAASALRLLRCEADDGACAWWLGERGVFVECAGVCAGPDPIGESAADADDRAVPRDHAAAWQALLELLRGRGAALPLHGIVFTVDADRLMRAASEQAADSALAMRRRLLQLQTSLGTRIPVYVVLTKVDALPGFPEFFDALDSQARRRVHDAVWGFTLPWDGEAGGCALQGIDEELELLHRRLGQALSICLEQELDLQRRCRMYEFPHAYAELARVLSAWIDAVFARWPRAAQAKPRARSLPRAEPRRAVAPLRGVFLASCAQSFAAGDALPPQRADPGRFAAALLRGVLLPDTVLARPDDPRLRRRRGRRVLLAGTMLFATGATAYAVHDSRMRADRQLHDIRAGARALEQRIDALRRGSGTSGDEAWHPVLRGAQELGAVARRDVPAWPFGRPVLQPLQGAVDAVSLSLQQALLVPRLARGAREDLVRAMQADRARQGFESLRAYLMLHDPQLYEPATLLAWSARHGETSGLAEFALSHPAGVLQEREALDQDLVSRARAWLLRKERGARLWWLVRERLPASQLPPHFSLAAWQAGQGQRNFEPASGSAAGDGVPGCFRAEAWQALIEPHLPEWAARAAAEDRRILGEEVAARADDLAVDELRHAYWLDYARHWAGFLGDVRSSMSSGLDARLQWLRTMASPNSPLLDLVRDVWQELQPLRAAQAAATDPVAARLSDLRPFVDPDGVAARKLLGWLDAYLAAAGLAAEAVRAGAPADPQTRQTLAGLRAQAAAMPDPIGPVLQSLGDDTMRGLLGASSDIARGRAAQRHAQILRAYRQQVVLPCSRRLAGRFPLQRGGRDADLDDFKGFFAPGGSAEGYFDAYLKPWVDTTRRPWRYRSEAELADPEPAQADGQGGVDRELLRLLRQRGPDPEAFARIASLREALWRHAAATMQWNFEISVPELDPRLTTLRLQVDGKSMRYAHGPVLPWQAAWPGERPGNGSAYLRLEAADGTTAAEFAEQGPWAWMHLLAHGARLPGGAGGGVDLRYCAGDRHAVLHLGGAEAQAWKPGVLEGFRCPR